MEEERLNRVKHSNFFPALAIRRCLELGQVDICEVDMVAMNFSERTRDIFPADAGLPSVNLFLDDPSLRGMSVRKYLDILFTREFETTISDRSFFCNHHVAHLWSAWGVSDFPESLLVSFDGAGDALSGMIGHGCGESVTVLRELPVAQSLGNMYSDSIRFLGYRRFDEYKAMGLAPYGDIDRFRPLFSNFFRLLPNGGYHLTDRRERWGLIHDAGLLAGARRAAQPFEQIHRDFAAALQWSLESIVLHVLRYFAEATGLRALCYAGGVAHNCALNGRLLYEGIFDDVLIQPAAHDAGGALGAALCAARRDGVARKVRMSDLFLGGDLPEPATIKTELESWGRGVSVERLDDAPAKAAELLADGEVIGWVQGRAEFGPRALGHRSILADPRPVGNRTRINEMVKMRESYRPFAPSILAERLADVVEVPPTRADFSFMTFALRVCDSAREELGAVTHVDASARIQTVSRDVDPRYWQLVAEFERLTGVPAVLNTSFNSNAEPIVDSIADVMACYLTTGIDAVIVGDFLVRKHSGLDLEDLLAVLRMYVPASRKLVVGGGEDGRQRFAVDSTASRHFVAKRLDISQDLHAVLLKADGTATLGELLKACQVEDEERRAAVVRSAVDLWHRRAIGFRP
ncbi:carbamoyltransferase family protein [Amycolatopsis speibonae]|uniref:Carbamoyltransferase n=1 Tax=Amycolatopsis speibonae TaxID=1450224 RepID=A0ABV7NXV7_9PSEU